MSSGETYTRVQFIEAAFNRGYAAKCVASEYSRRKDEFTDDDFEEVWRMNEWRSRRLEDFALRAIVESFGHPMQGLVRGLSGIYSKGD